VPFHLERKCDGCTYQEFCLKWSAQHDDLSLVPHLTLQDKSALQRNQISTVSELAHLKQRRSPDNGTNTPNSNGDTPSRRGRPCCHAGP
jgi:predicted RecB family nuclease